MQKLIKISKIIVLMTVFGSFSLNAEARQNVCAPIDLCAAKGSNLILPTWPLPVFACPFEGGNSICCTTCGPSVED